MCCCISCCCCYTQHTQCPRSSIPSAIGEADVSSAVRGGVCRQPAVAIVVLFCSLRHTLRAHPRPQRQVPRLLNDALVAAPPQQQHIKDHTLQNIMQHDTPTQQHMHYTLVTAHAMPIHHITSTMRAGPARTLSYISHPAGGPRRQDRLAAQPGRHGGAPVDPTMCARDVALRPRASCSFSARRLRTRTCA